MVDQVLKLVALFLVQLRVLLLDIVADITVHVAKRLGDRNVHLLDFLDVCLQLLDVRDRVLRLVSGTLEFFYLFLKEETERLVGFIPDLPENNVVRRKFFGFFGRLARLGLIVRAQD